MTCVGKPPIVETRLDRSYNGNVTGATTHLSRLLQKMPLLELLKITRATKLDSAIIFLGQKWMSKIAPRLQYLDFSQCDIRFEHVVSLVKTRTDERVKATEVDDVLNGQGETGFTADSTLLPIRSVIPDCQVDAKWNRARDSDGGKFRVIHNVPWTDPYNFE